MKEKAALLTLSLPTDASRQEHQGFARLCALLESVAADGKDVGDHERWIRAAKITKLYEQPMLAAAAHCVIDLVDQGWTVKVERSKAVFAPPSAHVDRAKEKARIRRQELLRRDEQLSRSSVRRFVEGMERAHEHGDRLVSVFNLMRDGRELADALQGAATAADAIKPYVQVVDSSTCERTGFKLHDIWRYFRHTWSNAYATVPGRSMPILIRDAATEFHTVIGLAAISSPIVQIAERDHWMGWETDQFLEHLRTEPTDDGASWLAQRIEAQRSEIYLDDLLRDGVLQPTDLVAPGPEAVKRLRDDAERHRQRHHQTTTIREVRNIGRNAWVERAKSDLFRSKRSAALADALEIETLLGAYLSPPTAEGLAKAFSDPKARTQMRRVVRRARGERVGTVIADLTVCGAVAPYSALAAGKLVGALAVSPPVIAAYREKYARPSEIASAMAGRPIMREARLSFVGTTSLYGTGSSQYNRLFWPAEVMGGDSTTRMGFHELGRSRSFGTSHFSEETVDALTRLPALRGSLVRVNSLFGEGVSPRLRKVRLGLAALGWPANELLRHGRERILYGVPLVENLRDYSLGLDGEPQYLLDPELPDADAKVAEWWLERWCRPRARRKEVVESMRAHRLVRPVEHGARVPLPHRDVELPVGEGMLPLAD
ncbi:Druantia anti-phage system protein DruA [Kitasatospora sp. NPDC091207]|uniref:Druantia anti-phage system protein DruA n=1 Tax=Kitasatospora sp. NPDC091207 TaxID=3364083 RepID=UPI0038022754